MPLRTHLEPKWVLAARYPAFEDNNKPATVNKNADLDSLRGDMSIWSSPGDLFDHNVGVNNKNNSDRRDRAEARSRAGASSENVDPSCVFSAVYQV